MKKIILLSAFAVAILTANSSNAQVRVSLNIGAPAYFDPGAYYANDADYYYMPECGAYYNVRRHLYFYPEDGRWISASYLPSRFNGYAYGRGNWTRVQERTPWMRGGYAGGERGYRGDDRARHYDRREGGYQNGGFQRSNGFQRDNGYRNSGYQASNNGGFRNRGGNAERGNYGGGRGHDRR